jgi:serine/threonine-protein kinase
VKTPQQKQQKGLSTMGKVACTGVASLTLACTGPQVRPTPPGEECPEGAVQTMAELKLDIGESITGFFPPVDDAGEVISVKEGWTLAQQNGGTNTDQPPNTILKGRLFFGSERVYGRFTEAQDGGRTWPVCMELMDSDKVRGLELESGSTVDTARVFNYLRLKAVDRFK